MSPASCVTPGQLQLTIHKISRLNEATSEKCEIYCAVATDSLPWVEIVNYGKNSYYVLDLIISKKPEEVLEFVFRQEFVDDKNQTCVILDDVKFQISSTQDEASRDDIILSIDGKKVTSISSAQKFIKSAAFQFTMRVERKVRGKYCEESSNDAYDFVPMMLSPMYLDVRRRKNSESESGSPSPTPSVSGSPANKISLSKTASESRTVLTTQKTANTEEVDRSVKILKSKLLMNRQVILLEENFTFQIKSDDKYLNINIRGKEADTQNDKLVGYINIPLVEVQNACDTFRCVRLKPPDSFAAASSRSHKLSGHNGFIPLLCFGDIVLTIQHYPSSDSVRTVPEIIEPNLTPDFEMGLDFSPEEKKHDFIKTHFQTSTQCEFCGKKIWLKDAERCRDCGMTCHKKCVVKCKAGTLCMPHAGSADSVVGNGNEDEVLRSSLTTEGLSSSRETTPQPTPTKKRLGYLLATVASASRGLKRVGSVNNLSLPGDGSQNAFSKSLPPSPQQSPAPSRKASLPLELNEEIATLLQSLLEQGSDQGDLMDFAKESGKFLYENLDLSERRGKIHDMINKLKVAISAEADVRLGLSKEEQLEKDSATRAKLAFLIGKSDEKTQALTILMLHFCAGLQHIQDLEDQEKEADMQDIRSGEKE